MSGMNEGYFPMYIPRNRGRIVRKVSENVSIIPWKSATFKRMAQKMPIKTAATTLKTVPAAKRSPVTTTETVTKITTITTITTKKTLMPITIPRAAPKPAAKRIPPDQMEKMTPQQVKTAEIVPS